METRSKRWFHLPVKEVCLITCIVTSFSCAVGRSAGPSVGSLQNALSMKTVYWILGWTWVAVLLGGLVTSFFSGCGDAIEDDGSSPVAVPEVWEGFCQVTFTEDYQVEDPFGELWFHVRVGDHFLMGDYDTSFDRTNAELYYLTDDGPITFEIEVADEDTSPFTSNCEVDEGERHIGVFADITLYQDEALDEEACQLIAGTAVRGGSMGYSTVSGVDFMDQNPEFVYEIDLGRLDEACNDHRITYALVTPTSALGSRHMIVPIRVLLGP